MKIAIYQINPDRDENNVAFLNYENLERFQGSAALRSEIYDKVFEGEVECGTLEEVYQMFNIGHPDGYRGRSLSVSDVVEVVGEEKSTFHFCDSIGFREVDFDPDMTEPLKEKKIKVVLCEPGKVARVAEIGTELSDLQRAVGGLIEPYYPLVDSNAQIVVGGIAATLLPDQIFEETGIRPICGLLNEPGKLGLPGDECIDQITPDYSMLEDVDYIYPFNDAYFLSATKGCGNKCGFCAVQTLEPTFIPYIDIKDRIKAIDERFGPKKDLILMDNNVLRSPRFNDIIDDIIAAGFGKGATYKNPRTGKTVQRYVDFNQGLDALFLTEEKARRLGEIALRPARVAFDHIEDRDIYERALRLCAKNGITELSNYVLYNSEDFGGKGKKYHADTPADLYDRMKITLDLLDELNAEYGSEQRIAAFSFPMRYIPLSAHERGYVGSQWNAKFLRAVQRMLVPTQGKGVCSRSFFEADFGKSHEDFVRYLSMPEKLIAARGKISPTSRGKSSETEEQFIIRKANWEREQKKIKLWDSLYLCVRPECVQEKQDGVPAHTAPLRKLL